MAPLRPMMGFTALVSLILFVWREARAPDPILHLGFFRSRGFSLGNLLGFATKSYRAQQNRCPGYIWRFGAVDQPRQFRLSLLNGQRITTSFGKTQKVKTISHRINFTVWQ